MYHNENLEKLIDCQKLCLKNMNQVKQTIKELIHGFPSRPADEKKEIRKLLKQNFEILSDYKKDLRKINLELQKNPKGLCVSENEYTAPTIQPSH